MGRTSISVSEETKRMLDAVRHPGQSYDGIIEELAEDELTLSEEAEASIERGMKHIRAENTEKWDE